MCAFFFGAAQGWRRQKISVACVCGGPAPDKDRDASVMAKPVPWLGVYFFLCAQCCTQRVGTCRAALRTKTISKNNRADRLCSPA
jgi:hypothetical protein